MTIEIHELDITDGLNKTLYDELKAENEKLKKQVDIAVKGLKEAKLEFKKCESDPMSGLRTICDWYMHRVYKAVNETLKELDK